MSNARKSNCFFFFLFPYAYRYFEDCPKVGTYKVRYSGKLPPLYFQCVDGVYTRTRKAKSTDILVDAGAPLELLAKNNNDKRDFFYTNENFNMNADKRGKETSEEGKQGKQGKQE